MSLETLGFGGHLSFEGKEAVHGMHEAEGGFAKLAESVEGFKKKIEHFVEVAAIAELAKKAFEARAEFEEMETQLGTTFNVLSGGGHIEQAFGLAREEMEKIEVLALRSPAKANDLLGIYKQLVGTMSAQGHSLEEVRDLTFNTTIAAKAMGVDFQTAGHAMYMLEAGTARQHDQVYRLMQSQGLITKSAEEWNAQTPVERHKALMVIMSKYGESAIKVSKTWGALSSGVSDVFEMMGKTAIDPFFERAKGAAATFLDWFVSNKETIDDFWKGVGGVIGDIWDNVVTFGKELVEQFKPFIPEIVEPLKRAWEEIKNSFNLVIDTVMDAFGLTGDRAEAAGGTVGIVFGVIAEGIAQTVETIANVIGFVAYVASNIGYAFQVVGQRIGETIGEIVLGVQNTFADMYNIITEPIRMALEFIQGLIHSLDKTSFGHKMLVKAGIDMGDVDKSFDNLVHGTFGKSQLLDDPGYGKLPESPEEKELRLQVERMGRAHNVKVEVKQAPINLNLDGKKIAQSVTKSQLELKDRAGAHDSPWQRTAAVAHSKL